jgi:DNA-binding LacI/PurR family transcriptional regulator
MSNQLPDQPAFQTRARPATLHDVARLAQVSHQTVSRVVNDSPNVSDTTRRRVQNAIRELDYRPNRTARSLITRRSQTLQAIAMGIGVYGPVSSILFTAKKLGYQVALSILNHPFSSDELRDLLDELTARTVDGFVFITPEITLTHNELVKMCRGTPFVQIASDPGAQTPSVVYDQRYGMNLALQHLHELGHRQIAEITGPLNLNDAAVRHQVYLDFIHTNQLAEPLFAHGDFQYAGGYQAAQQLLQRGRPFTALICGNDQTALGALRAVRETGLRIPKDVSLVGFDDEPFAAYLTPPLTTVRQDYEDLGRQSIEYLVALVNEPQTPTRQRVLYPEMIIRQSTCPPE